MEKVAKKRKSFFKIVEYIVNIIVYPILIISFVSSFFMLVARSSNLVSPIFNKTFVRVLSGSMSSYCPELQRSFKKGDIAIIKTGASMYNVGDVIAFYYYHDPADNKKLYNLTEVETKTLEKLDADGNCVLDKNDEKVYVVNDYCPVKDNNDVVIFNTNLLNKIENAEVGDEVYDEESNIRFTKAEPSENRVSLKDVVDANTKVYFHQIVQIKVDNSGTIFYVTKGTSNTDADSFEIREDFVVGKYANTPKWLANVISFCASTEGMLLLVVIPISIIVMIELLSVIEQINNILLEKKVINRQIPFDTKECEKANIGLEMRDLDKIYFYDVLPNEYKMDAYDFLWGCLKDVPSKKQQKKYALSKIAVSVYNVDNVAPYYKTWESLSKSKKFKALLDKTQIKAENDRYADVINKDYQNYKQGEQDMSIMSTDEVLKKETIISDKKIDNNIYDNKTAKLETNENFENNKNKVENLNKTGASNGVRKPPKRPLKKPANLSSASVSQTKGLNQSKSSPGKKNLPKKVLPPKKWFK